MYSRRLHLLLTGIGLLAIIGCDVSEKERQNIAAVTCSILAETRNMDGALRVKAVNDAREELSEDPFLDGDEEIKRVIITGDCESLILNNNDYHNNLKAYKEFENAMAKQKLEAERLAEKKAEKARQLAVEKEEEYRRKLAEELRLQRKLKEKRERQLALIKARESATADQRVNEYFTELLNLQKLINPAKYNTIAELNSKLRYACGNRFKDIIKLLRSNNIDSLLFTIQSDLARGETCKTSLGRELLTDTIAIIKAGEK